MSAQPETMIEVGIQRSDGTVRWVCPPAAGRDGETIRVKPLTFRFSKGQRFETYPMAVYPVTHPGAQGLEVVSPPIAWPMAGLVREGQVGG